MTHAQAPQPSAPLPGAGERATPLPGRFAAWTETRAAVWLVLLCVALPMRLLWVGDDFVREHSWNEGHYACITRNLERYGLLDQRSPMGRDRTFSPFVPILLWPAARLSSWQPWGFRAPLVAAGLFTLWAFHALMRRRWGVGAREAWLALLLASTAPAIFFFSRNIQLDGLATAFLFAALLAVGHPSPRLRALGWIAWGAAILAKTTFLLFLPAVLYAAAGREGLAPFRGRVWLSRCLFAGLALIPLALWMAYCFYDAPAMISPWLTRSNERSLAQLIHALTITPQILWRQLTPSILFFGLLGLVPFLRGQVIPWRRLPVPLWVGAGWVVFIFTHPLAYSANQYYTYPALYIACLLAAAGLLAAWSALERWLPRTGRVTPAIAAVALALITLSGVRAAIHHYGSIIIDREILAASMGKRPEDLPARPRWLHGADVFREARLLGAQAPARGKILVDYPSTMFHAGADPEHIDCTFGPVTGRFDPAKYVGVLLRCLPADRRETDRIEAQLRQLGWRQLSPNGWLAPEK